MTPRRLITIVALAGLAACAKDPVAPGATVYYRIDAPLCSSYIAAVFSIDSVAVGSDTFVVNLAPEHLTSRGFHVSAGAHRIGAQVPGGFVWPDTTLTLAVGDVFTDTLPFYCS
ncbi:MAG TPA: hypothetical protein VFK78_11565 [Gemmatimonadales bacterium]|nr:hypothetical protein [Gemmatimonadales bacterium]